MKLLVTGAAGFIGSFVAERLAVRGDQVIGIDSLNDYYDPALKQARLARLEALAGFAFERADVADRPALLDLFRRHRPRRVVHLAAQAGVRHSIQNPHAYVQANLVGFANLLEACRELDIEHLVYASTSSVYGANTRKPFSEHEAAGHPLSMYAASKRCNELMAHAYSHLFRLPATGLRFFTVYGPWGRPDQALFSFTRSILADAPIEVYNHGHHRRDFTYIDDVVQGTVLALDQRPAGNPAWDGEAPDPASSAAPYRLYNIGGSQPVELMRYIECLERCLGRKAKKSFLPLQPGDMPDTWADADDLAEDFGCRPATPIETGVERFVAWYCDYYGVAPRPGPAS